MTGRHITVALAALLLTGCSSEFWGESNCNDKMDDMIGKRGEPEEVRNFSSDGYKSQRWWYWSQGVSIDYTWGSDVDGCQTSVFTFTPIR